MDAEVSPASRSRSSHRSPDPEMAEGGGVGGWPMVGDKGRHSAGGSGLTVACERLSALRVRPVGRSLAQESGSGRCDCRPVRRRSGGGFRTPCGGRAIPGGIPGTPGKVRPGITCGEDAADRVWTVRRSQPKAAGRGKARDLHVSGLYALLREAPERWSVHRMARDGKEEDGGQAPSYQDGAEASSSRADSVRWCLAPEGDLGLLPIPRCSREFASARSFPLAASLVVVACIISPQSTMPNLLGPAQPAHGQMDSSPSCSPSLPYASLLRY